MIKHPVPAAGYFNPRVLLASLLGSVALFLALAGVASTPSSGALSPGTPTLNYSAGPFNTANPSPLGAGQLDSGPRCSAQFPCDNYLLTVNLPGGYSAAHPNASVRVTVGWVDATGTGKADYDFYIYKGNVATTSGSMMADYQSASGNNPEVANISPLTDGTQQYSLKIVPYTPTGETVQVHIELLPGTAPTGGGGGGGTFTGPFGGPDATAPGVPRFQNFYAPHGTSAEGGSGEFNIGYNPVTNRIMTMNSGPIWRLTPPESQTPALPECCEAFWQDRSSTVTDTGLDPILWTDQKTGRTFASNSTAGANGLYAFTDSDGEPTTTAPTGWTPIGAAPPNGADHETIVTGPYPPLLSNLSTTLNQGQAVYYCSQDVVGPGACQRSDNLGSVYGASVPAYYGNNVTAQNCGGLHGHLHVAPDGTAWLPINQCAPTNVPSATDGTPTATLNTAGTHYQGGSLSITGGATWQEFIVPNGFSQSNGADPSIAIDKDSTIYYSYVKNEPVAAGAPFEGHVHVAVGQRTTVNDPVTGQPVSSKITWLRDVDVGIGHGIINAAHTEAVGGDSGRAAVGFMGTNMPSDYQNVGFPGKWYVFIAMTYDQGRTWTTVNATPNDPVQNASGIWQQGGGVKDRNLLDFNEITLDKNGRVLYGYSDGCVSEGCIAGTAPNDFQAFMRVARQSGGKTLYAAYDASTDTTGARLPKPSCLSGTRTSASSILTWKAPDNGGSDITNYHIFRGTSPGTEVEVGQTRSSKTVFTDTTASPSVPTYYYVVKADNAVGTGTSSNEIILTVTPPPPIENVCALPGRTILTDASGDNTAPTPGTDLHSFQISQPYSTDGVLRLGFTINTDPGVNPQPANSAWYVAFKTINGATTTYKAVHMAYKGASPTGPTFESYTPAANTSGTVDGRFVTSGSEKPAEAASSYDTANGKITIVVKASDLGVSAGQTIAGFVSGVTVTSDPGGVGGVTETIDMMPESLAYTGLFTVQPNSSCAPSAAVLTSVGSRKTHGSTGTFDINMPLTGTRGIECRNGGANGNHTLVFTFTNPVSSVGGASVTPGSGGTATVASSGAGANANEYVVNLTGVSNAQVLTVNLTNVQDSVGGFSNLVSVPVGILAGDTNADGVVNASDVSQTRAQSGQTTASNNFREDLNFDGVVNASDVSSVRSKNGTSLP